MLKSNTYFNIKWLIIAVGFTAIVVLLTHIPQEAMPPQLQIIGLDKLAHILAYGAITYLFVLSLRTSPRLLSASLLFLAILGIGAIDELTQPFFSRTASLADWLADIIGVSGVLLFFLRSKRSRYQSTLTTQHPTPET
ncbi:MAG: VanZ family protein [Sedimentisphaerales bacterium]|nr:VanZ family protein [Sedimentisphaerales bacterium]